MNKIITTIIAAITTISTVSAIEHETSNATSDTIYDNTMNIITRSEYKDSNGTKFEVTKGFIKTKNIIPYADGIYVIDNSKPVTMTTKVDNNGVKVTVTSYDIPLILNPNMSEKTKSSLRSILSLPDTKRDIVTDTDDINMISTIFVSCTYIGNESNVILANFNDNYNACYHGLRVPTVSTATNHEFTSSTPLTPNINNPKINE